MRHALGVVALSVLLQATSCGTTYQTAREQEALPVEDRSTVNNLTSQIFEDFGAGYFTVLLSWGGDTDGRYAIIYANDTKVKYFVFKAGYNAGITPLYHTDGSLQVYDGSPYVITDGEDEE